MAERIATLLLIVCALPVLALEIARLAMGGLYLAERHLRGLRAAGVRERDATSAGADQAVAPVPGVAHVPNEEDRR